MFASRAGTNMLQIGGEFGGKQLRIVGGRLLQALYRIVFPAFQGRFISFADLRFHYEAN